MLTSSRSTLAPSFSKLQQEVRATSKLVEHLRTLQGQRWSARLHNTLPKFEAWRWIKAATKETAPLKKAIASLTLAINRAKRFGSSVSELKSSTRVLFRLKAVAKQLAWHKVPRSFAEHMKLARAVMPFLEAAAHPHVYHHGYIYATMDFANPSGDDDDGPPTAGCQKEFLSLPKGWRLAPSTSDSQKVSSAHGWNTDCLSFSDGQSWATDASYEENSCGSRTLLSNKNGQYRPQLNDEVNRRILIRFPVPKFAGAHLRRSRASRHG